MKRVKAFLGWLLAIPLFGLAVGMFFTSGVHAVFLLILGLIALPPLWRELDSMGWRATLGARSGVFAAGLVALAAVTVMTEPFGERSRAWLAGTSVGEVTAPVLEPIARAAGLDEPAEAEEEELEPEPLGDPRLAGLPSAGDPGITPYDIDVLHAAALYCMDELGMSGAVSGDKSAVRGDTYYLNFGHTASYAFRPSDIPHLDERIARLPR